MRDCDRKNVDEKVVSHCMKKVEGSEANVCMLKLRFLLVAFCVCHCR